MAGKGAVRIVVLVVPHVGEKRNVQERYKKRVRRTGERQAGGTGGGGGSAVLALAAASDVEAGRVRAPARTPRPLRLHSRAHLCVITYLQSSVTTGKVNSPG